MSWPSQSYIEGLVDLINLKSKVGSATTTDLLPYPNPTNYQKLSLVTNMQRAIMQLVGGAGPGPPFYALNGGWIVDQNYDGFSTTYPTVGWYTKALTPIDWPYIVANVLGGHDWEATYHREVVDNTSTVEIYRGAAIANGQRAYRRSDKQIVDRVAGAWVPNLTATHADYVTDYGPMIGGDFFRDKLFQQMEDVLALLTTVGRNGGWTATTAANSNTATVGSDPTEATAKAIEEGNYDGATPDDSGDSPRAYSEISYGYDVYLARVMNTPVIAFLSGLRAKTVTFYGLAQNDYGSPDIRTFEAFGDPVLDGLLKTVGGGAAGAAATTYTGAMVGSLAKPLPWPASPPVGRVIGLDYRLNAVVPTAIKYTF